jgi:hypothetical protein
MAERMDRERANDQLLTSWKEIAMHLGKGVRTIQRWERELGLPIRRPAQHKHIVVALTTELDEWISRLSQPAGAPCCSCSEQLGRAQETILALREQLATMESALESAMRALRVRENVSSIQAQSQLQRQGIKSDGNAA